MNSFVAASPEVWRHFSDVLGLTADLLPVAADPNAKISPGSSLQSIGKVPSTYTPNGLVIGIPKWTERVSTAAEIAKWSKNPALGICLQTRVVRAIDIDIDDPVVAGVAVELVSGVLQQRALPMRMRANSGKCLLAFRLPGEYSKRIIRTPHGLIEFLATGQQAIVHSVHVSGARYEWQDGLPTEIPELTPEEFERVWTALESRFGSSVESTPSVKKEKLASAVFTDPVAQLLIDRGLVVAQAKDGRLDITCPFESGHSTPSAPSSTSYYPAHTGGYVNGHFHCLHASCAHRSDQDFRDAIGARSPDFEDLTLDQPASVDKPADPPADTKKPTRFNPIQADDFAHSAPAKWIIKGVLPQAELAVIYGAPGSGKSFATIDIGLAIAQGEPWCGRKVAKGNVVYIAAEGAGGVKRRLLAYAQMYGIDLADIDFYVIPAAPNLLEKADIDELIRAIHQTVGKVDLVIIDTLAQATAGGDENSGQDMTRALMHCKRIRKYLGAMVLLVHHSGKDASRGARGWSGLRGAVDAEFEVVAADNGERSMAVTKQKDGEDGLVFGFRLSSVPVGLDEDGEQITSCVVKHTGALAKPVGNGRKLGVTQQAILDTLIELQGIGGARVSVHDLETAVVDALPAPEEGKRDARRQHARRSISTLVADGVLDATNGWISIVGKGLSEPKPGSELL